MKFEAHRSSLFRSFRSNFVSVDLFTFARTMTASAYFWSYSSYYMQYVWASYCIASQSILKFSMSLRFDHFTILILSWGRAKHLKFLDFVLFLCGCCWVCMHRNQVLYMIRLELSLRYQYNFYDQCCFVVIYFKIWIISS